jgi:hypothetical protein
MLVNRKPWESQQAVSGFRIGYWHAFDFLDPKRLPVANFFVFRHVYDENPANEIRSSSVTSPEMRRQGICRINSKLLNG